MTYYKNELKFTNSPLDSFVVYDGQNRVESDYRAQERAMRVEAIKYAGRQAIHAVGRVWSLGQTVMDDLNENVRI